MDGTVGCGEQVVAAGIRKASSVSASSGAGRRMRRPGLLLRDWRLRRRPRVFSAAAATMPAARMDDETSITSALFSDDVRGRVV